MAKPQPVAKSLAIGNPADGYYALKVMQESNGGAVQVPDDEIVSAIFTTTSDLNSTFPAEAARTLGMHQVPLLCASEIPVPGSMPRCIRVLLHVNTSKPQSEIVHVYLRDAQRLRPDVMSAQ